MDSKFYVSLEAAKLLKEKGYDEECTTSYDCVFKEIIPATSVGLYRNECMRNDYYCSAPTKSEAIDWLESKGIVVQTIPSTPNIWRWRISSMKYIPYDDNTEDSEMLYKTRLEAEDDAIINALTLL